MTTTKPGSEPAFPNGYELRSGEVSRRYMSGGLSARAYTAIHLGVPDSGEPWLDEIIRQARRERIATAIASHAMVAAGIASDPEPGATLRDTVITRAHDATAALIAASESGAAADLPTPKEAYEAYIRRLDRETDAEIEAAAARIAQRQGKRLSEMTRKEREAYRADAAAALDAGSNADDR